MNSVTLYLGKFLALEHPDAAVRVATCEAVREVLGFSLLESEVVVRGRTVYVGLPATQKAELFMRQEDVVAQMEVLLSGKRIPTVR